VQFANDGVSKRLKRRSLIEAMQKEIYVGILGEWGITGFRMIEQLEKKV